MAASSPGASGQFDVSGIELSPRLVQSARKRINPVKILEAPLTEIANKILSRRKFRCCYAIRVYEWQPLPAWRAAHRLLKPGDLALRKTPNFASRNRRVMELNWCGFHILSHCNCFTPKSLVEILRRAGFQLSPRRIANSLSTSRFLVDGYAQGLPSHLFSPRN
jgi:hypothetical protein